MGFPFMLSNAFLLLFSMETVPKSQIVTTAKMCLEFLRSYHGSWLAACETFIRSVLFLEENNERQHFVQYESIVLLT
jgi:hypothetical protein